MSAKEKIFFSTCVWWIQFKPTYHKVKKGIPVVDDLEFVLMGTLNVRKGRWEFLADILYMDLGNSATGTRDATIGGNELPVNAAANLDYDMKSWVWTLAGYYSAIEKSGFTLDVLGGARHLDVE